MKKYAVDVTFEIIFDAENEEQAENWGYDITIVHPQTGEHIQPWKSDATLLSEDNPECEICLDTGEIQVGWARGFKCSCQGDEK